jgi:3-phosphoshikimate 1-carboxyvinyltransferase
MNVLIYKSHLKGTVNAPPSKSYTIRALICAALADGESHIFNPLVCDDTSAVVGVLTALTSRIDKDNAGWAVTARQFPYRSGDLFCGDSAATLRFLSAVCTAIPGEFRLTAGTSLARRPVGDLVASLRQLGAECEDTNGYPPVKIRGNTLKGGKTCLTGNISSQYVSALLLAAPLAPNKVTLTLDSIPESRPYIEMTLECMRRFGIQVSADDELTQFEVLPQRYHPAEYTVEGDWSSASYFLSLGATIGEVTIKGLDLLSRQGDKVILDIMQKMGADISCGKDIITVSRSKLRALQVDVSDCIDLLPTLAVSAAAAEGRSELTGIKRARLKESDRVVAICDGLTQLRVPVTVTENSMIITGRQPESATIDAHNDHRIAMAFSIPGTMTGNIIIRGAECVTKTFPGFWNALHDIGGEFKIYE